MAVGGFGSFELPGAKEFQLYLEERLGVWEARRMVEGALSLTLSGEGLVGGEWTVYGRAMSCVGRDLLRLRFPFGFDGLSEEAAGMVKLVERLRFAEFESPEDSWDLVVGKDIPPEGYEPPDLSVLEREGV